MFFPENDQEQPSESWKAKDCFCFFQLNFRPLLSVFISQLSLAVSGQNEEETVAVISPPSQREMNDSPQHHGIWMGISLFIWKKFGPENRLKVFPNLGSSCKIIYSFHIFTHFIKYLLHAGNGLWDKSLYLLIVHLCAKHYSKYLINEIGLFSFTGRNWNLRRLTNSISTFIKQDKKEWRRDLNLGKMSWAPKCLTVIFLCLNEMESQAMRSSHFCEGDRKANR